jgi:flavin-dependent dehydrogenase
VSQPWDCLVIGGGPAGAAAAIALAHAGLSVAILERSRYDAPRIGETLPPSVLPLLHRLGFWEAFRLDEHLPSPGIVSVWGDADPYENDFIFSPYGNGWHLDRRRFDATLAAVAEQAGVQVLRDTRILSCTPDAVIGWRVEVHSGENFSHLEAAFLIDASGRASWLGRRLGVPRRQEDQLVGVVGLLPIGSDAGDHDPRTLLEAAQDGWWYSAPVPKDRRVVAYMTDVDLLPEAPRNLKDFWTGRLRQTVHTLRRVRGSFSEGDLRIVPANSYRMERVAGSNWLAVGDAATAWDPLSSQGIQKALESGLAAARTVGELRSGNLAALDAYGTRTAEEFSQYRGLHAHYYGRERRWPDSPFWNRRRPPQTH